MIHNMNDYKYLLKQLDLLIGFLDVSEETVFNQIRNHDSFNIGITVGTLYEDNYKNYSSHICNATVLLGFANFEDFLGKCIKRILIDRPELNDFTFNYKTYQENNTNLVGFIAESKVSRMKISDKLTFANANIPAITQEMHQNLTNARHLRNCLAHENGIADTNLGFLNLNAGDTIVLNPTMIHDYGFKIREYAEVLWANLPSSA